MVNPDFELERLRLALRARGLPDDYIEDVMAAAARDINMAISNALADAMEAAVQAGQEKEAEQFINEVRAVALDNDFYVTTDSGNMDFSEPPFPMLAHLLRNPKVAKDGTLYKVIPVGSKPRSTQQNMSSLIGVQAAINDARNKAAGSVNPANPKDVSTGAMTFSGNFAAQKAAHRDAEVRRATVTKNKEGANFRTATSRQDPTKHWVLPAKDKDMTTDVLDINSKLRENIDIAVLNIVQKYEEGA